jgi:hypothetical protein
MEFQSCFLLVQAMPSGEQLHFINGLTENMESHQVLGG